MPPRTRPRTTGDVVYVAGAMRSGTTIIGQVVAASPSTLLIGELRSGVIDPELHEFCDCGRPRAQCEFWTAPDAVDLPAGVARRASSLSALPVLLASSLLGRPLGAATTAFVAYLRAALAHADGRLLVDTSKTPTLVLLWRLAGARVHVVQAIRAPLDVARAQARPTEVTGVPQRPVPLSLAVWLAYQAGTFLTWPFATTRSVVGFRSLLARPLAVARTIWARSGAEIDPAAGDDGVFAFGQSHVLAGNPRRTRDGRVVVRPR